MGIAVLLFLLGLVVCPAAFSNGGEFPVPPWSQLRFEASQALQQVSTEVSLQSAPDVQLIEGTKSKPILTGGDSLKVVTAKVRAKLLFKRKQWSGRVWFDGATGAVLQRVRLKYGEDANRKSFRFGYKGVDRVVDRPRNRDEAELPADAWSNTKRHYFPYPMIRSDCDVVSDPLLIIISASDVNSDQHPNKRICVFNKKTLYHVGLKAEKSEQLQASYVLTTKGRQVTTEGPVTATKIRISANQVYPTAPDRDKFEFLGLDGQLFIWVDTVTHLPLVITSEISDISQVSLQLTAATLP